MIQFFKKKRYPKFWQEHLDKVQNSQKYSNFENIRFVAIDTETTGFDFENDRILCIGAVAIKNKTPDKSNTKYNQYNTVDAVNNMNIVRR